jgi:hypothetical protein
MLSRTTLRNDPGAPTLRSTALKISPRSSPFDSANGPGRAPGSIFDLDPELGAGRRRPVGERVRRLQLEHRADVQHREVLGVGASIQAALTRVDHAERLARVGLRVGDEARAVLSEPPEQEPRPAEDVGVDARGGRQLLDRAGERELGEAPLPGGEGVVGIVAIERDEAAVGADEHAPGVAARREVDAVVLEPAAVHPREDRALREVVHLRRVHPVAAFHPGVRRERRGERDGDPQEHRPRRRLRGEEHRRGVVIVLIERNAAVITNP